jgi:nucleotide-binding universal stress UspA family protein
MFKRVLVAIDGSPASAAGFRSALDLASDQKATLVVLHVIDDASLPITLEGALYPPSYADTYFANLEKLGRRMLDGAAIAARNRGIKVELALTRSDARTVADVIVGQARKSKVDVIVLGTHGRRGLRRVIMGSDAENVLRQATVPVLLVRGRYRAPRKAAPKSQRPARAKRAARLRVATPAARV